MHDSRAGDVKRKPVLTAGNEVALDEMEETSAASISQAERSEDIEAAEEEYWNDIAEKRMALLKICKGNAEYQNYAERVAREER